VAVRLFNIAIKVLDIFTLAGKKTGKIGSNGGLSRAAFSTGDSNDKVISFHSWAFLLFVIREHFVPYVFTINGPGRIMGQDSIFDDQRYDGRF